MANKSGINRRSGLALVLGGMAASVIPNLAFAMNQRSAKKLVDRVVADINAVIDSGKSEDQMLADFEKIFVDYADVATIARYALGVEARAASPSQLLAFTAAFQKYISTKYGKRFREFIGGKVEVQDARAVKSFFEVKTIAHLQGSAPFEVTFLVSDGSGEEKFFNMFIEGLNMLLSERTEIGAMLDKRKGDLDKLIADLKSAG